MNIRWSQVLPALAVGLILGVAAQRAYGPRFHHKRMDPDRMVQKLTRELRLNPEQQKAIESIVDDHHKKLKGLRRQTSSQFQAIRASMKKDMAKVLHPDQLKVFEAMQERWEARRKRSLEKWKMETPQEPNKPEAKEEP